ncbi:MAG: DNA repair protein RecO [Hyphomicrobiales bacterium]|nr:DNA repair protein RecO [Hyphomicrobiales bacterium]
MQWTDEGIVLGVRRHGEASAILELMTREHGRHLGLVRGAAGRLMRPVLQAGNLVSAVWRARLDEHLGHYAVEVVNLRVASLLTQSHAMFGVTHLAALCRLLPERDPHPSIVPMVEVVLDHIDEAMVAAALVVRFELHILSELGFGLELDRCALTGKRESLAYVSPRTGRAVSLAAGEAWRERLLRLPSFLAATGTPTPLPAEIADGFALTGHFLRQRVLEPRGAVFAEARDSFIAAVIGRSQTA